MVLLIPFRGCSAIIRRAVERHGPFSKIPKTAFGLLYFHPDSIRDNTTPPRLAFTGIDLFGEPIPIDEDGPLKKHVSLSPGIRFAHWQNDLTIHYAALHFKNPAKNSYRIQLGNYDNGWRDVGHQNFANYTNLDPGRYTFRVKAANSDGIWNEESIALDITILPPWYWNGWSQALYLVLIIGLILGVYRFQLNRRLALAEAARLKELDSFKTKLYTNITHEFRTPLTVIEGMAGQITGFEEERDAIRRNSRNLLNLVNRMLGLSKLEAGRGLTTSSTPATDARASPRPGSISPTSSSAM